MARARRSGWRCRASSQAIMSVQLLSWCAAACLLLYRGVTTLRREPPPRPPPGFNLTWLYNGTAADYDSFNGLALSNNGTTSFDNGIIFPYNGLSSSKNGSTLNNVTASNNGLPPKKGFPNSGLPSNNGGSSNNGLPSKTGGSSNNGSPSSNVIPSENGLRKNGSSRSAQRGADAAAPRMVLSAGAGVPGVGAGVPGAGVSSFARLRRELRPASLILIVLGFSMLLVGPVVVVLRKCDSTLSQRRASKVPTEEEEACDPPPSYDEATRSGSGSGAGLLSVAPRYSSLFHVQDSGELVLLNPPPDAGVAAAAAPAPAPAPVHCVVHKVEILPACRRT